MIRIPAEFIDIPEAAQLRLANTKFEAAIEREKRKAEQSGKRVHFIGNQLREAMDELKEAEKAFDAATGEPKKVGLTPAVIEEISHRFPAHQQQLVQDTLDGSCGRTLPLLREASAQGLEIVRLAVLKLSNGDLIELQRFIDLAHVDWRDVVSAARAE